MRITGLIFSCLFIFLSVSCSPGSAKKNMVQGGEKTKWEALISNPDDLNNSGEESFDQFIRKFSLEESFQFERIKFPVSVIIPDNDNEGTAPIHDSIGKYDWEMLDLSYDSTYLTRPYDQYSQMVRFEHDTAVVEIRGINNGIYADYYFTLINKKWYLVMLYDASF